MNIFHQNICALISLLAMLSTMHLEEEEEFVVVNRKGLLDKNGLEHRTDGFGEG